MQALYPSIDIGHALSTLDPIFISIRGLDKAKTIKSLLELLFDSNIVQVNQ